MAFDRFSAPNWAQHKEYFYFGTAAQRAVGIGKGGVGQE